MQRFIIEQSETETYTSNAGLSLVGVALDRFSDLVPCIAGAARQEKSSMQT